MKDIKVFKGSITEGKDPVVTCNGELLESSTTLGWGYKGEGSRRLAWIILGKAIGFENLQGSVVIDYRDEVIANLLEDKNWIIAEDEVLHWLSEHGYRDYLEGAVKQTKELKDQAKYLLNKIEEQNIVKATCKELGITQKELAEKLEVSPASVSDWAKGNIPKMTELALKLLIENKELKQKLYVFKEAYKIASEL